MKEEIFVFKLGNKQFQGTEENIIKAAKKAFPFEKGIESIVRKSKKKVIVSNKKKRKGNLKFLDVIHGATAILKDAVGLIVNQKEINRRAIICSNCPKRTEVSNCLACGFGRKLSNAINKMKSLVGKDFTIPNNLSSSYCDFCGCSLLVMLPSKMDNFKEKDSMLRPDHCWVNPKSKNYHVIQD